MLAGDAIGLDQLGCLSKHCDDARHLASHRMKAKMDSDRPSQGLIVDGDSVPRNHACIFQSTHPFGRARGRQSDFLSELAYRDPRVLSESQQYRSIDRIDGACHVTASVHDSPQASSDSTTFVEPFAPGLFSIPVEVRMWMPRERSALSMALHFWTYREGGIDSIIRRHARSTVLSQSVTRARSYCLRSLRLFVVARLADPPCNTTTPPLSADPVDLVASTLLSRMGGAPL